MIKADPNHSNHPGALSRRCLVPALASAATPAVPAAHLDAHLLHLGALLDDAWSRENEAWVVVQRETDAGSNDDHTPACTRARALTDATGVIVERIENARALTLEGLLVKVRAITWCRTGEPLTAEDLAWHGEATPDMRLLATILGDLSTMGRA